MSRSLALISRLILLILPPICSIGYGPATAAGRTWNAETSSFGVEVMYGSPDSGDVLFAIRCDSMAKEIFVGFAHDPVGAQPGTAIDLDLYSEGGHVVLPAVVSYLPGPAITLIETIDVSGAGLRPIFTDGETLDVTVVDGTQSLPLSGARETFDALFAACDE